MNTYKAINREACMMFFRDDEKSNELTVDDRIEMFCTVLAGSSNFTKELRDGILSDYCVEGLAVVERGDDGA